MFFTLILSSFLTFVELNCENLFDTRHDSLKNDYEFLPQSSYKWTPYRYWRKLANLSKTIVALGYEDLSLVGTASPDNPSSPSEKSWHVPDFVALSEVENDSVLFDLTRRSALRGVNYDYVMTDSPDDRGIDVACFISHLLLRLYSSVLSASNRCLILVLREIFSTLRGGL